MTDIKGDKQDASRSGRGGNLLLLFDGNALVHRAFHALPPLTVSRTGEMVNAVYGFANTLLKVLADFQPSHWGIAFDRPTATFRHKKFEGYKAQRPATPEELKNQIQRVHELAEAFHIPIFEVDGFEADDILGTLSQQANACGIETVIVTGDNDMLQLVTQGVKALAPKRAFSDTALYDEGAVRQKYGINPEQIPDFKALVGDTSDNIPGIPGIGAKTATKLIQQYGSLEGIYAHIDDITPSKLQTALREYQLQTFQNRELVTVVKDVPIQLDLESCRVSHYDRDDVVKLFQELEFINLLPRLPQKMHMAMSAPPPKGSYQIVDMEEGLERLAADMQLSRDFVIETVNGDATTGLVGIALSPARGRVFYIPLGLLHPVGNDMFTNNDTSGRLSPARVVARLKPLLENADIGKIAHNGKYVIEALASWGVELENLNFDTMIAAYLLGEKNLTLQALAFSRSGMEMTSLDRLTGRGKKQGPEMLETKQLANYACANADAIWGLRRSLEEELQQQGLWQLFMEVEMPLIPVLAAMEENGITLDTALLREMSLELGNELLKLELQIYNSVGHKFNINSPKQLASVLFEELRLPQSRKRKGGYSTEAATLEALTGLHPIIELILQYRQLSKIKSTYVDILPALINPKTGRVHTTFSQVGTSTGRLSSSEPNLQNIPVRGPLGNRIRRAIIASPGSYLLSADYSQIDLRVLAHLSRDPGLIAAFANGEDIHATTASKLFGVPVSEVTEEMRRAAKTVNFGVIYGMSDYGLEQATNFSREAAAQFIQLYFERYPKVREYIEATKEQARKLGYVQTVVGRRRFIPEINSPNRQVRESAERMAINAPVQGSSADIIKIAMVNLHREMKKQKLTSKMLLQIHDELIFEVPREEIGEMKSVVAEIMTRAVELCVPLKVDIKIGKNLGEMTSGQSDQVS